MKWDSFFIEVKGETVETIIQPDDVEICDTEESESQVEEVFTHKSQELVPIYDCSSMFPIK